MKRKLIALILSLMLICGTALADIVPLPASMPEWDSLKRYASWTEAGSGFSVYSNEAASAIAQIAVEQGNMGYFYLELTGDLSSGLIQPVMVFLYSGTNKPNADTVAMVIDDTRCLFKVSTEQVQMSRNTVEVMRAPLTPETLEFIRLLPNAEKVMVRMMGDYSYEFTPEIKENYQSTRQQVEASSLVGTTAMLDELEKALHIDDYMLWDLSAERWELLYGFKPEAAIAALGGESEDAEIKLSKDFELLSRGNNGGEVRDLQKLLIERGFMQALRPDGDYGSGTIRAVKAARRFYNLMDSSATDRVLITCLETGSPIIGLPYNPGPEMTDLGNVCRVGLTRGWFADTIVTEKGAERTVSNADNTLLVLEGELENTSAEELTFYWTLSAALKTGDVSFPATIVVVTDNGQRFDTSLLPLGKSRVLIYAEIPENAIAFSGWTLEMTAGESVITYQLGGNK